MTDFEPGPILETLSRHGVEFVLIGGVAALAHGSPLMTVDLDIVPQRQRDNLARLSAALTELNARVRTEGVVGGLKFSHDAKSLGDLALLNLVTPFGDLDLAFVPSGTEGYEDLIREAAIYPIEGVDVSVASIEDLIRSKLAANRPKDKAGVAALEIVLRERESRHD